MEPLAGQVGAVTFAGGEVGAAIAGRLARAGATVVMLDPDGARADAAAAAIRKSWGTVAVQEVDPHGGDAAAMVADIVRTCGGLDALVLLMDDRGAVAEALLDAALPVLSRREHGLVLVVEPEGRPRIGRLEEALSAVRRRLEVAHHAEVRCYGLASLPPGGGELGAAAVHLAVTRPSEELDGRLVLVPPPA